MKSLFETELAMGMQQELRKQASAQTPDLTKAAECLHAALEIFEAQGLTARADQVLEVLRKIAQHHKTPATVREMPSVDRLAHAGFTERDMREFAKGSPVAKAKLNLVLRHLGMSEHEIGRFIGPKNVMSEKDAREIADPNRSFGKMWDWMQDPKQHIDPANPLGEEKIHSYLDDLNLPKPNAPVPNDPTQPLDLGSFAKKFKTPRPGSDRHTKGLTPAKMVENLKHHGTEFNMADDQADENNADIVDLLNAEGVDFDIDGADDFMNVEVDDSLEVFDGQLLSDFEDEKR